MAACALACVLSAPAQANLVGMVETQVGTGSTANLDLIAIDTATGTRLNLPTGVNTSANELHPSVTADGRFAVFQRNAAGAAPRIIMVNLETGEQADLFSGLESSVSKPATPAITPDAERVVVGRDISTSSSAGTSSKVISVDVSDFPGGPFPKTDVTSGLTGLRTAMTRNPSVLNDDRLVWRTFRGFPLPQRFVLSYVPGDANFADLGAGRIDHPALQPGNPGFSVFQRADSPSVLVVRGSDGTTTPLPAVVNTARDEARPVFEAGGRYLAFIRTDSTGSLTLRVWDSTTQELVNPAVGTGMTSGSSLNDAVRNEGAVALFIPDPLITRFTCCRDRVRFTTSGPTTAGLLVQRIRGSKRLLGRRVPKLKRKGRFPLGRFDKGKHKQAWDLEVRKGGKNRKLKPGCYLVTLRALTRKGRVRELSKPYTLRVRKGKQALFRKGVKRKLCRRN